MKILIEEKIPYIHGVLERYGTVEYMSARSFSPEKVKDADAVFIRTSVRCDQKLLENSKVRFIASATIGLDHVDKEYCHEKGITVANAPGCNADAVAQWVFAVIKEVIGVQDASGKVLGIVGVGNIGGLVDRWARSLGMRTLLCDPPREERREKGFCSLNHIANEADIITFHTPLSRGGKYPTYHLCDDKWIKSLKNKPLVMNASRGGVADNNALMRGMDGGNIGGLALDVWEGEPKINLELLKKTNVATPHIAGYSRNGKIRATEMSVRAFCDHFKLPMPKLNVEIPPVPQDAIIWDELDYDIMKDDKKLRESPWNFTQLRDEYPLR